MFQIKLLVHSDTTVWKAALRN